MSAPFDPSSRARPGPLLISLLPLLALALNWAYLGAGFAGDDVIFLNLLREGNAPPWWRGLWSEVDLPALTSLWWVGALDAGGFWRPLPSLFLEGALAVFGENAFPLHLFAVLLHGVNALLVSLLTGRLVGNRWVGLLAGLFFAACEDHSMVVGWITTVTDVLCAFFLGASLVAHLAWLERRHWWPWLVALVGLVLALGCKESAVAAPFGLAGLTAAFHARRAVPGPGARRWIPTTLQDWLSWAPGFVLLAAYLATYRVLGFGVGGSVVYADPLSEPLAFLEHLVSQLPVLWLATLSPVPPSLGLFWPATTPLLAILGLVLFALFLGSLWMLRREPVAWWALVFYLVALVPQTGAEGSERALYVPMLAGSVLLSLLAARAGPLWRRLAPSSVPIPRLTRAGAWWAVGGVLVPGLVLSLVFSFAYRASFELPGRQVTSLVSLARERAPRHVLVLNTSGPFLTFYLGDELSWRVGRMVETRVLSSLNGVVTLEREGARSFVLRTDRRGWLTNFFAMVPRSSSGLEAGQAFSTDLFTATILELAPGDGPPDALAVRFDLAMAPDDPRLLAVSWDGSAFVPLDLAAMVPGARLVLADTSDVWAGMM